MAFSLCGIQPLWLLPLWPSLSGIAFVAPSRLRGILFSLKISILTSSNSSTSYFEPTHNESSEPGTGGLITASCRCNTWCRVRSLRLQRGGRLGLEPRGRLSSARELSMRSRARELRYTPVSRRSPARSPVDFRRSEVRSTRHQPTSSCIIGLVPILP